MSTNSQFLNMPISVSNELARPTRLAAFGCALFLMLTLFESMSHGQSRNENIATSDDFLTNSTLRYSFLGLPIVNNSGQVVFTSSLYSEAPAITTSGIILSSDGDERAIVLRDQSVPDGNGDFQNFFNISLTENGNVNWQSTLSQTSGGNLDNGGLYSFSNNAISELLREGESAPDNNGIVATISQRTSDSGLSAGRLFFSDTANPGDDNIGLYLLGNSGLQTVVREGMTIPDGTGQFDVFQNSWNINDTGKIAFNATLRNTSLSTNKGIYVGDGNTLTTIARKGQSTNTGDGVFVDLDEIGINSSGQVAFSATATSGELLLRNTNGINTAIVRSADQAPDGNGTFTAFDRIQINDIGQVLFEADIQNTFSGNTESGIFLGDGTSTLTIARQGDAVQNFDGVYRTASSRSLSDSGQVLFFAVYDKADNTTGFGLFVGDGTETLAIATNGQSLLGSEIESATATNKGLNNYGQVAYVAELADGRRTVQKWTPDLNWRSTDGGNWDDASNWTLGLNPAHVHDVTIDPTSSVQVMGPSTDREVRNFTLGGTSSGQAALRLQNGAKLTVNGFMAINQTGTLTGDGIVDGQVINNGTIIADNLTFQNGFLQNLSLGTVQGNGRIDADFVNGSTARVRVQNGDSLWFSGPRFTNGGLVEINQGELRVDGIFSNQNNTGLISIRDGSLYATSGIHNRGSIAVTQGDSVIHGDIDNDAGIIQVSGGAHATFFGDVIQNGTLQVASIGNTNSVAVFLGELSGSGGFVGGGDVFALGDLRPGNSPDSVLMDGNLFLGSTTLSEFEFAGEEIGEFDQLIVTGDLSLNGDLSVSLLNGFEFDLGQEFIVADVGGQLFGQFSGLDDGDLIGTYSGRQLFVSYSAGDGNDVAFFTAVPEPAGCIAAGLILIGLLTSRRQRSTKAFSSV